jgi:cysteine desulfurase
MVLMRLVYLDHAATTPVRAEVFEAMRPLLTERFGNPSSVHRWGREARALLEDARDKVAAALGAKRSEIVFTSGGTEADNLAVLGGARALGRAAGAGRRATGDGNVRVVVSAVEHKAVLGAAKQAMHEGAELVVIAVDENGVVDLDALDHALSGLPVARRPSPVARTPERSCIVSIMWGNNEVGALQPVKDIAALCQAAGVLFHTDAVQAFGRVRVRVDEVQCDLLSISGHKIGAPKGIGALFVRSETALESLVHGGGQEREVRPGTENIAGAVALGVAAELAAREQQAEEQRLRGLRDRLQQGLLAALPDVIVNASSAARLPHVLNVSFPGVDQEALLVSTDMEGMAVSSGSACQSGSVNPSHVLSAMNRARVDEASLRLSLGRSTTEAEIDDAMRTLPAVVSRLRTLQHLGK